jgi:hypothetical protein
LSSINNPAVNSTPICLAESILVWSTHSRCTTITLGIDAEVSKHFVPTLHKPPYLLLSASVMPRASTF